MNVVAELGEDCYDATGKRARSPGSNFWISKVTTPVSMNLRQLLVPALPRSGGNRFGAIDFDKVEIGLLNDLSGRRPQRRLHRLFLWNRSQQAQGRAARQMRFSRHSVRLIESPHVLRKS